MTTLFQVSAGHFNNSRMGLFAECGICRMVPSAHRALPVRNRLQELFGNCVVGMGHQIDWPAKSPDLSPLDFYLWGTVKQRVYRQGPPASLRQLWNRITDTFNEIWRTREVKRAVRHIKTRAQRCVNLQGGHVDGRAWLQWVLSYNMICSTKPNGTFQSQQSPNGPFQAIKNNFGKERHCHMPSLNETRDPNVR